MSHDRNYQHAMGKTIKMDLPSLLIGQQGETNVQTSRG